MGTIAATLIKKSRRVRYCEGCNGRVTWGESLLRLYGYAHEGDRPYRVYLCLECANRSTDLKVWNALNPKPTA